MLCSVIDGRVVLGICQFRSCLVFGLESGAKKFICLLSSCVGLNFMSVCVWFILAVIRSGRIFLESYIFKISST